MYKSEFFTKEEQSCPCGCDAKVNEETLKRFDNLRREFGKPIYMEQMATCKEYSLSIGRKETSTHIDNGSGSHAGDIKHKTFSSKEDYFNCMKCAIKVGFTGFGQGAFWIGAGSDTRFHIDDKRSLTGDFRSWTYGINKEKL